MPAVRPLNAERTLRLVPRDEIVAAVEEFDRKHRLAPPPHDPQCSPLQVGDVRDFTDYHASTPRKAYVVTLVGNHEITVIVPMAADGSNLRDAVSNLADVVTAELYPPPADD
jgi:hypothetical protein